MGHDVFISHSTKDKEAADAVCAALESSGLRCWIAPRDIKPGKIWAAQIMQGINQCRLMVLVYSAYANNSKHVGREIERADARGMPILTLRIQDVMPHDDLEYFLSNSQWLDALNSPIQKHLPDLVQLVQASLPPAQQPDSNAAGPGPPPATTPQETPEQWAAFIDAIQAPELSGVLLLAWTEARDRFRASGSGDKTDVRAKLDLLGEHLAEFNEALAARWKQIHRSLATPAAAKHKELLHRAVDAVQTSPSGAEFPAETRAALERQFGEWIESSEKAQQAESATRTAVQMAAENQRWAEAWTGVDALETHTGRTETQLRGEIAGAVISDAQSKGDSGTWGIAIDLLTQFGRLEEGDGAAAPLRESIVTHLLKAAASRAGGDAKTRQAALDLLSQVDRVSNANADAAELRRRIEARGYYEMAAARIKEGAFQEAADSYQKASDLSYPVSDDRLKAARALAAADAVSKNETVAGEQLEQALKSLASTPALNPDEQAHASALTIKIQSALSQKRARLAHANLRGAILAAIDAKQWLDAWKAVDALEKQTRRQETQLREQIVEGVVGTAEAKGDGGTWKAAIDLLTQFGRLGDGDTSLRERMVAGLMTAAGSKASGDLATRQEALNLLSQLDRISKANAKAADLRRQIDGKGFYETAAARVKEGAFQEAADNYQKAKEQSYPGSAERLQIARVLAAADGLSKNDKAAVEQLEQALKGVRSTSGLNADEQAHATALTEKIQSALSHRKEQIAQDNLRGGIQAAIDGKRWLEAWKSLDALEKQAGRKETHLREQVANGVVGAAETKGDGGTWKAAIDLLIQFGRLGDADASLRERIDASLLKAAASKAGGDSPTRKEALSLLSQLDRVSKANTKAADLRRHIDRKGFYEIAAARVKEGAFQEAVDNYQKASERAYPGSADRLRTAGVLAAADALSRNDQSSVEQLEPALKSLTLTPAFNSDEQAQATALSAKLQSALARKKAQRAEAELRRSAQAVIDGKQWIEAWRAVDALDHQTGRNETDLRERIINGIVGTAESKGDSGAWKIAIDLLTQFGRLGDGVSGAASPGERIVAGLLKAAGLKADGDTAARREALNLLSQVDRVSKGNAKAAEMRRRVEGKDYFEYAAARVKEGAFQEAADNYQKAGERSCPGSADRLRVTRILAAAAALLNSDKAAVEQLEPALKSLTPTTEFNADERAQANALSKKIQSALARKYFELADGQEQATPPSFAAAADYYRKSAGYGRQDASAREQAARQLIDVQKLKAAVAIKKLDKILPGLNDTERRFANSLRNELAASLEERPQEIARAARPAEKHPGEVTRPVPESREKHHQEIPQQAPGSSTAPREERPQEASPTLPAQPTKLCSPGASAALSPLEIGGKEPGRGVPGWAKVAAVAAALAVCTGGVVAYQNHRPLKAAADNHNNVPVSQVSVPGSLIEPSLITKPDSGSPRQAAFVNSRATSGPTTVPATTLPVDPHQQWARFLKTIPTPALSDELLPAWTAQRDRFAHAAPGNETQVLTSLNELVNRLDAFERALMTHSNGLSPALTSSAAEKRKELFKLAVNAVRSSPTGSFPDQDLETQFINWVAKTTRDAEFDKKIQTAIAAEDFTGAARQLNAYDSSYQGLASLQQALDNAEGAAVNAAEAHLAEKKYAEAWDALAPVLALSPPPAAAAALNTKIVDEEQTEIASARDELLVKSDAAAASAKVTELLNRDPQCDDAWTLLDEIATLDEQQGDIDAAQASYKVLSTLHPSDSATQNHYSALIDLKPRVDDVRMDIKGKNWPAAAKKLSDLAARSDAGSFAAPLWSDVEDGLLIDATAKGDAASWATAIGILKPNGRLNDALKQRILDALQRQAERKATPELNAQAEPLLSLADQLAPNNPRTGAIRKKIAAAATAKSHQDQIDKLKQAAAGAELRGDLETARADYAQASALAPDDTGLAQQAIHAGQAVTLASRAQSELDEGNPGAALKTLMDAGAGFQKSFAMLIKGINDYKSTAQANYLNGTQELQKSPLVAKSYFESAARGGSADAMLQLGDLYHKGGKDLNADEKQAKTWWQRALDAGNTEASKRLNPPKSTPGHKFDPGRS